MARGTPKRAGRTARPGAHFPGEVLASNVQKHRRLRGLKQSDVGDRMTALGHEWSAGIVGFVERGDRAVTVDEMVGLALALNATPGDLLDPAGPDLRGEESLDVGGPEVLPCGFASQWVRNRGELRSEWAADGTLVRLAHRIEGSAVDEYFGHFSGEDDR